MDGDIRQRAINLYDRFTHDGMERRAFMGDVLGIRLKPEVLPLSNLAGAMPPYWLSPDRVFASA